MYVQKIKIAPEEMFNRHAFVTSVQLVHWRQRQASQVHKGEADGVKCGPSDACV